MFKECFNELLREYEYSKLQKLLNFWFGVDNPDIDNLDPIISFYSPEKYKRCVKSYICYSCLTFPLLINNSKTEMKKDISQLIDNSLEIQSVIESTGCLF
jgi:hypothetical protein